MKMDVILFILHKDGIDRGGGYSDLGKTRRCHSSLET